MAGWRKSAVWFLGDYHGFVIVNSSETNVVYTAAHVCACSWFPGSMNAPDPEVERSYLGLYLNGSVGIWN